MTDTTTDTLQAMDVIEMSNPEHLKRETHLCFNCGTDCRVTKWNIILTPPYGEMVTVCGECEPHVERWQSDAVCMVCGKQGLIVDNSKPVYDVLPIEFACRKHPWSEIRAMLSERESS